MKHKDTFPIVMNMYCDKAAVVGLIRTVVSMVHCGCTDRSSILRLDNFNFFLFSSVDLLIVFSS